MRFHVLACAVQLRRGSPEWPRSPLTLCRLLQERIAAEVAAFRRRTVERLQVGVDGFICRISIQSNIMV